MITRDWILDILGKLDLLYWPIFLWEIYWLDRYLNARRVEHSSGLIGFSVCRKGRVYITLQAFGDKPRTDDWTLFAPRAPWQRLAPGHAVEQLRAVAPEISGLTDLIRLVGKIANPTPLSLHQHVALPLQPP